MKSIIIIGCGWLGKITASLLIKFGYSVIGTTRDTRNFDSLKKTGITPLQLDIKPGLDISIPEADAVLISISPGRKTKNEDYIEATKVLGDALAKSDAQVMMCSSTSVYDEFTNKVVEQDLEPDIHHPNRILSAEGVLKEAIPDSAILRLGGIYGYDRHPVFFLSGRKSIRFGDAPVNLIHADDAAAIIKMLIEREITNEIFNLVAPIHPSRNELYCSKAREFGLEEPEFLAGGEDGKIVDSTKLVNKLGYEFIYPDPLQSK